jgi:hypothetical protein
MPDIKRQAIGEHREGAVRPLRRAVRRFSLLRAGVSLPSALKAVSNVQVQQLSE